MTKTAKGKAINFLDLPADDRKALLEYLEESNAQLREDLEEHDKERMKSAREAMHHVRYKRI